jgi:hypothetical protein
MSAREAGERGMSVSDASTIDIIGVERSTNCAVMAITDHLDWADVEGHLEILQAKVNTYINIFESGELLRVYPDAEQRMVVIRVLWKHDPPPAALRFVEQARQVCEGIGLGFEWIHSP